MVNVIVFVTMLVINWTGNISANRRRPFVVMTFRHEEHDLSCRALSWPTSY